MKEAYELQAAPVREAGRLPALDAARGLAVIGMFVQHFALNERNGFVSGNTMTLFILCSGISYTLMARGMEQRRVEMPVFRARVLARSVFIDLAGYLILMLNGPFGVVLQAYAMLFLLALPLVKRSTKTLAVISAVCFAVCPPLMLAGMSLLEGAALLGDIAGGPLSALAWLPVFTAGMAIGRLNLRSAAVAVRLAVAGAAVLIPVKLFSLFVLPGIYRSFYDWLVKISGASASVPSMPDPYAVWPRNTLAPLWHMLFLDAPQGGSSFELLIGTGGSLLLLAAVLLLEKRISPVLKPFAQVGRAALTLYCLQFILAWILMLAGADPTSLAGFPMGDIVAALLVLAAGRLLSLWKYGPLEAAVRRFEGLFYAEKGISDGTAK